MKPKPFRRRSFAMLAIGVIAACAAFAAATAQPARTQTQASTLTGETLFACRHTVGPSTFGCAFEAGTIRIRARCTGSQGTVSWTATGPVLSGPYPGTFSETGTATIANNQMAALDVTFRIDSLSGDRLVRGRKFILEPTGGAVCDELQSIFRFGLLSASVRYEATITPATGGTFEDEGQTFPTLVGNSLDSPFVDAVEVTSGVLHESFISDLLFACPSDDDEDGDGVSDTAELGLGLLVNTADSDGDGITDGDDDANGNGEDDEDEDDDDECPDEDSDGDGEDDEDEDDDEDDDD